MKRPIEVVDRRRARRASPGLIEGCPLYVDFVYVDSPLYADYRSFCPLLWPLYVDSIYVDSLLYVDSRGFCTWFWLLFFDSSRGVCTHL